MASPVRLILGRMIDVPKRFADNCDNGSLIGICSAFLPITAVYRAYEGVEHS